MEAALVVFADCRPHALGCSPFQSVDLSGYSVQLRHFVQASLERSTPLYFWFQRRISALFLYSVLLSVQFKLPCSAKAF